MEVLEEKILKEGTDAVIIATGSTVQSALEATQMLKHQNMSVAVVDMRFVKPIDKELLNLLFNKFKVIVTVEDNVYDGGLGEEICFYHVSQNKNCRIKCLAVENVPLNHGKRDILIEKCGIDAKNIAQVTGDEIFNAKTKA